MSKHTPGPWEVNKKATMNVQSKSGLSVASAGVRSDNTVDQIALHEELEANARLIASAPELLEALKVTTSLCRLKYGNLDAEVYNEILRIESIIAKAEGKV